MTDSPWDVDIQIYDEVHEATPDRPRIQLRHASIELGYVYSSATTCAEQLAAYRYVAGVVCRATMELHKEFGKTRTKHNCGREWDDADVCHISATDVAEVTVDSGPFVAFYVPRKEAKQWLAKIRDAVNKVLTTDQYQTTTDDEAWWQAELERHAAWRAEPKPEPVKAEPKPEPPAQAEPPSRLAVVREVEPDILRCRTCGAPLTSWLSKHEGICAGCDNEAANQ